MVEAEHIVGVPMTTKEMVIDLVDQLSPEDLEIARVLLERLAPAPLTLDELRAHWDLMPPDDEPISEGIAQEIAEANARWERDHQGIPHSEVRRRTLESLTQGSE